MQWEARVGCERPVGLIGFTVSTVHPAVYGGDRTAGGERGAEMTLEVS